MFKVINDIAEEVIKFCKVNYWNSDTPIYTAAITVKEHLGEIYSEQSNDITERKQFRWKTVREEKHQ